MKKYKLAHDALVEYLKTEIFGFKSDKEFREKLKFASGAFTYWSKNGLSWRTKVFLGIIKTLHGMLTTRQKKKARENLKNKLKGLDRKAQ